MGATIGAVSVIVVVVVVVGTEGQIAFHVLQAGVVLVALPELFAEVAAVLFHGIFLVRVQNGNGGGAGFRRHRREKQHEKLPARQQPCCGTAAAGQRGGCHSTNHHDGACFLLLPVWGTREAFGIASQQRVEVLLLLLAAWKSLTKYSHNGSIAAVPFSTSKASSKRSRCSYGRLGEGQSVYTERGRDEGGHFAFAPGLLLSAENRKAEHTLLAGDIVTSIDSCGDGRWAFRSTKIL